MEERRERNKNIIILVVTIVAIMILFGGFLAYTNTANKKTNSGSGTEVSNNDEDKDAAVADDDDDYIDDEEYGKDKEPSTEVKNYITGNPACYEQLEELPKPKDDKTLVESLKKDVMATYKDLSADSEKAFIKNFNPTKGVSKYVYHYYVCMDTETGKDCKLEAAARFNGKWITETQEHEDDDFDTVELVLLQKFMYDHCGEEK